MKNRIFLCLALLVVSASSPLLLRAQGIFQLWGTTFSGGHSNRGTLYSTRADGSGHALKKDFVMEAPGVPVEFSAPSEYNGKLYSILNKGDDSNSTITEYDLATQTYTQRADLILLGGRRCDGKLTLVGNKFYGVTSGLPWDPGFLFQYDPATHALTKIHTFTSALSATLAVYDTKLYGYVNSGGNNNTGYVYEYYPTTNTFTIKAHFAAGSSPGRGGLALYAGRLWGVKNSAVFSFDPLANLITEHTALNTIGVSDVYGAMAVMNDRLYGVANSGGMHDEGAIFEFNPANQVLTNKYSFLPTTATRRSILTAHNGKLYSASIFANDSANGVLFSYDPVSNTYENRVVFTDATGYYGTGSVTLHNGRIYGFTRLGATHGEGCLFEYDPAANLYLKKVDLGGNDVYHPTGRPVYLNGKLYGSAIKVGSLNHSVLYEYDLSANIFAIKLLMPKSELNMAENRGMTLHNQKLYGATLSGGAHDGGVLFEFDPVTSNYATKHEFSNATGRTPSGRFVVRGNKLYGTCMSGSTHNAGNIFEFDLESNTYAEKAVFGPGMGAHPEASLIEHDGKIYGVARNGGNHNSGVLFEYNPLPNSYVIRAHFDLPTTGSNPMGNLIALNNRLYGMTNHGASDQNGGIYEFDPSNNNLTLKLAFDGTAHGREAMAGLEVLNNKLYGVLTIGTPSNYGSLYEFDPANSSFTNKTHFTGLNGKSPRDEPAAVPAPVAPGTPDACMNANSVNITPANANQWIAFTDAEGRAIAELNANGNVLGRTSVSFFVHTGPTRKDANDVYYLNRNISIESMNQPETPVSLRLYIRGVEYQSLAGTPNSGLNSPADLALFKNDDACEPAVQLPTVKLPSAIAQWGADYVVTTEVSAFSSFYFASDLHEALPVKLTHFAGKTEEGIHHLSWAAECDNDVTFVVEKSTDGRRFAPIGTLPALQAECNTPFRFTVATPSSGLTYYRLRVEETDSFYFSQIIALHHEGVLADKLEVMIAPNPVTGSAASLLISSTDERQIPVTVLDATGRKRLSTTIKVAKGVGVAPLDLTGLGGGLYFVCYLDNGEPKTLKLLKN